MFESQSPNVRFYTRFIAHFVLFNEIFGAQKGSRGSLLESLGCGLNTHKHETFALFVLWSGGASWGCFMGRLGLFGRHLGAAGWPAGWVAGRLAG